MSKAELKTVKVTEETLNRLKSKASYNDSMDLVVNRILDVFDKVEKKGVKA